MSGKGVNVAVVLNRLGVSSRLIGFNFRENGKLLQKRYNLHYSFLLPSESGETIAANCPNCGGAITSTHQKVCAYCGSRLANVMKNTWEFTEVYEK